VSKPSDRPPIKMMMFGGAMFEALGACSKAVSLGVYILSISKSIITRKSNVLTQASNGP